MKTYFVQLSELKVGGEPLSHVIWCVGIIVFALLLKKTMAGILTRFMGFLANKFSEKKYADIFKSLLQRPLELLLTTILFYIAINQLTVLRDTMIFSRFNENGKLKYAVNVVDAVDKVFLFFIIIFITLVVSRVADFIFHIAIDKAFEQKDKEREQLFPLIKEVVKILLWAIGFFWILGSVFNVNIPALITGLGIGGVAIALAAKESVENFFASFTILMDKPFTSGDSIKLGDVEGQVEKVGFRSTHLRSTEGSLFIVPNKNLIGDSLENLTERNSRRVKTVINIQYGVTYDKLQEAITALETLLKNTDFLMRNSEVLLEAFNENSFALSVIYYLPNVLPDNMTLNAAKQMVHMEIFKVLDDILPSNVQKHILVNDTSLSS